MNSRIVTIKSIVTYQPQRYHIFFFGFGEHQRQVNCGYLAKNESYRVRNLAIELVKCELNATFCE